MRIFITGASGFIGGAIAKSLGREHEISVMSRSELSRTALLSQGFKVVASDLASITEEPLKDHEVVIHCAAFTEEWGTEDQFFDTNVRGTERMLDCARKAGVKRFIYIATEAAFFDGSDLKFVDESQPYAFHSPYSYSRTKAKAERLVLSANSESFETISLRPRLVWGPGDKSILPAISEMIRERRFVWISNGQFETSTTHIENLVQAVSLAIKRGKAGEAYFISDEGTTSLRSFLENYLATQNIRLPTVSLPKWFARLLARIAEAIWAGVFPFKKPPLVRFSVDMMSASVTLNTTKAKEELGYHPLVSREAGLRQMSENR